MNLADGRILDSQSRDEVLNELDSRILKTLGKGRLKASIVINACGILSKALNENDHLKMLLELGYNRDTAIEYLYKVKEMLSEEYLRHRMKTELGDYYEKVREFTPPIGKDSVREEILPIGVLLHIAAGNADGLPVFSVIEGLLTGNINILKLPEIEDDLSVKLLLELIKVEPALSEYIYVFDYSSKETDAMIKLAEVADAVVVWGSDIAVSAVRKLVKPDTKIIEWGHKISFAYVTEGGLEEDKLRGLALNICETNQLLCSSCQGIFLDTDSMYKVYSFSERFVNILEEVSRENPSNLGIGMQAQITLQLYNESLEAIDNENRIFRKGTCSVIAGNDHTLEPGIMFRNCWVKRLPKRSLLTELRPYKNHLQTVGLLCANEERSELSDLFAKTGIVKISRGETMSTMYCGGPHDGEYPLRRYTKVVSYD